MNLVQAFKKRNKLQNKINYLRSLITSSALVRKSDENEDTTKLDGMTCKEWLDIISLEEDNLYNLVHAIDEANKNIKPYLSKIQQLKNRKNFREELLEKMRRNAGNEQYYAESDKVIKYVLNLKQKDIIDSINLLNQEIEDLENLVSDLNAKTIINDSKIESKIEK